MRNIPIWTQEQILTSTDASLTAARPEGREDVGTLEFNCLWISLTFLQDSYDYYQYILQWMLEKDAKGA